jgi:hypothetical protein
MPNRDETTVLGLFADIDPAANALNRLQSEGKRTDQDLMVLSSVPFPEGVLEADHSKVRLPMMTVIFAVVGILTGILLAGGSAALYVLRTGGKPILAGPPIGIITYEIMMLFALSAAFFTALYEMRLPSWRARVYDPRIAEGLIGIATYCPDGEIATQAEEILKSAGAVDVRRDARGII